MNQKDRLYNPGRILYVDSNSSPKYDCFGVVVDSNFWLKQAVEEANYSKEMCKDAFNDNRKTLVRVLGTKVFEKDIDEDNLIEPNREEVFNYIFRPVSLCHSVDLEPFIKFRGIDNGRAFRAIGADNNYFKEVINEAELIYSYMAGQRFEHVEGGYMSDKDRYLRMLELAIPLEK